MAQAGCDLCPSELITASKPRMSDMDEIAKIKTQMRKTQTKVREELHASLTDAADKMAGYASEVISLADRKLGARMSRPLMVAGYWPMHSEIDPMPLIALLCNFGCESCLPATPQTNKALSFHRWRTGDALVGGRYKTKQPAPSAPRVIPQLVLVPLLAFDSQCFRLGYGGGFYDRTLEQLRPPKPQQYMRGQTGFTTPLSPYRRPPPTSRQSVGVVAVGVAFAGQEVPSVPTEDHDLPLDAVVCEYGLQERKP